MNRNKFKSSNPIFEEWISEWRDEAIARDMQSKHTYSKCLNSLRKYPLPLKTGKECIILEGFGDKICKLIDEKLVTFLNEGGKLHEDEDDIEILSDNDLNENYEESAVSAILEPLNQLNSKYPNLLLNQTDKVKKTTKKKSKNKINDEEEQNINDLSSQNDKQKRQHQKSSKSKEYMPEFRSGAYALLITLYKHEETNEDESVNYMLKSQLIKDAQKHCDSQFVSSDPRNHYTAWNSMSNLIKKSLVDKENKLPARYRLTDSGRDLAKKLLYGINENSPKSDSDSESDSDSCQTLYSKNNKILKLNTETNLNENKRLNKNSNDCIEILDSDSLDCDILPSINDKLSNKNNYDLPVIDVYSRNKTGVNNINNYSSDSDCLEDLNSDKFTKDNFNDYSQNSTGLTQQLTSTTIQQTNNNNNNNNNQFKSRTISFLNEESINLNINILCTLEPSTFDIILFVDNCEQSHAKRQDLLIDELKKSNIKYEFGKLNVGDFAWIARSRKGTSFMNDDLILNCIVERKRMDDLCQSIIDGRYKEQKFRLKKSGITQGVYLIEDYGSMKHMSLPEKSLIQADVNTQLIDHLIVHHSTDPKDSAYYLIQMTKYLTEKFKNRKLNAVLKKDLDEYNKKCFNSKSFNDVYLMTFKEFNEFSNKNKPLTVKEMFAKCLMKIQGVSQEKCLAIVENYSTPSKLIKEFSKWPDESNRVKLIANLKYGSQQRNVGPAIAKIIVQLLYTNAPLN